MQSAEHLWRLLPSVRSQERDRFGFFLALGALLSVAQMVGLAGAEALFLARLGAQALPLTFVLASAATVLASLAYALRVGHARNDRVLIELLVVGAAAVAAATLGLAGGRVWAAPALLCLYFATQAVFLNHFWTLVGDFFDTLASKRMVPLFTVGTSLGGAVGGGCAVAVIRLLSAEALLPVWSALLAASALLVAASRRRLSRWRTLDDEEDETSVAGMRAAFRYLRGSALGRWLVLSALAMVLALFVAQYLYSDVFAASFPDESELASFIAIYLAITNLVEIGVEVWIAPALIARYGVPAANLVHPVLTVASFGVLWADYRLPAAIAVRANRELLDNALAQPVRTLVYNALPLRFRSRVRAFLEGVVVYSGMSLAGVALLLTEDLGARELCVVGAGFALLYGLANWRVRREYLDTLVTELRAGRFDPGVGAEIGPHELGELATQWGQQLRQEPGDPGEAFLELAPLLAANGFVEPVRAALDHPSSQVRAAALSALASASSGAENTDWAKALTDAAPSVRLVAVRTLAPGAASSAALRQRLADEDPAVRAEAAHRLGGEGESLLAEMVRSPDADTALAALALLPDSLLAEAEARTADPAPRVRAAALERIARTRRREDLADPRSLDDSLGHSDGHVRKGALLALAARDRADADELLGKALRDPARAVRSAAVASLAQRGERGLAAALLHLDAPEESSVGAALRVLGTSDDPSARAVLRRRYVGYVREAWETLLCVHALPQGDGVELRFQRLCAQEAFARAARLAMRALTQLEDETVVRSAERTLRFASGRARGDAFEVLTNLGDREASRQLVILLEPISLDEKIRSALPLGMSVLDPSQAVERARRLVERQLTQLPKGRDSSPTQLEEVMQQLLSLRRVSLFSHLSLERLQALLRLTREAEYVRGEVIVREGTPGRDLYLLMEGEVDVLRGAGTPSEERLNTLGAGSYFGEIAILDGSSRSATVVALGDVRVLVLEGQRLRELVFEMPDIAFDIFRVLAQRIRHTERRLLQLGDAPRS